MAVMVTGGAGFIGSHLVEKLLSTEEVVCVDDFNDFYDPAIKHRNLEPALQGRNFHLRQGDIRDPSFMEGVFREFPLTEVIHLAARAGVRPSLKDPLLYEDVNGRGTLNILELCRKYDVKRFIYGGSSSVYGINNKIPFSEDDEISRPVSPYAATKRANELMCYTYHHLYGIHVTVLRFFTVYGPRQRPEMAIHKFTRLIDEGLEVPLYGDGSSRRDYTYVDDIIQGVMAARASTGAKPYDIFNLGESRTTELRKLVALIENALGKKARIKWLPDQPGDVPVTYADISKSKGLLGYNPQVTVEEGIPLFVKWYQEMKVKG
ncbi:MAG: GDP-mannose 4,6-dehydratase [Desulfovibrionales bacterium]|nr:GDP-mannose 4,6-dehydratase [Desulfovibrionales bacterium]